MYSYVGGFSDTAGAMDNINNPDPDFASYPSLVLGADQAVIQFNLDGTNDPISASLLGNLIHRVQALYKHH